MCTKSTAAYLVGLEDMYIGMLGRGHRTMTNERCPS